LELWYTEKQTPAVGIACKVRRTLCAYQTPYQHLSVLETEQFGNMLVLDGMVQITEADEFVYHEMITHVPLCAHPCPRNVLVVGGGDGGAVREILKHETVEEVALVEIDEEVINASRRFLPGISSGLDDPRLRIFVEDGIDHVRRHSDHYDVIIIDSTEPVGAAAGLFQHDFYASVYKALTANGVMTAQTESPFFNADLIRNAFRSVDSLFPVARLYLASVPTYPSGLWSFTLGSKAADPVHAGLQWDGETRYWSHKVHTAAFVLPPFVRELIQAGE